MNIDLNLKTILRLEYLGVALILILFSAFDFYPKLMRAGRLNKKIKSDRIAIKTVSQSEIEKQKKELEEELSLEKEEFQLIQQAILAVQARVIKEKNIPLVTQEIIHIADSSDIELTSIKPLDMQGKDGFQLLPVKMRFRCGYTDLIKFLSKVEGSPALVAVQDLSIKKDEAIYPELDISLTACALFIQSGEIVSGREGN